MLLLQLETERPAKISNRPSRANATYFVKPAAAPSVGEFATLSRPPGPRTVALGEPPATNTGPLCPSAPPAPPRSKDGRPCILIEQPLATPVHRHLDWLPPLAALVYLGSQWEPVIQLFTSPCATTSPSSGVPRQA